MQSLHLSLLQFHIMDDIIRNKVFLCYNETLVFLLYIMENNSMIRDLTPKIILHICTTKFTPCYENSQTRHTVHLIRWYRIVQFETQLVMWYSIYC